MNRSNIIAAVQEIADQLGYAFRSVPTEATPAHAPNLPLVVMTQPQFRKIEGRHHGKITYRTTLHIMQRGAKSSPNEECRLFDFAEATALDIFARLSTYNFVLAVEDLQMTPSARSLTTQGDVTISATADIICPF